MSDKKMTHPELVTALCKHPELVTALCKHPGDIISELMYNPQKAHLWHMSSCIQGEAGEVFDAVKKHVLYNKPLDRANLVEELGDLEFYLEGLRQGAGISREETLIDNHRKLTTRYASLSFSNKAAQERVDKNQIDIKGDVVNSRIEQK